MNWAGGTRPAQFAGWRVRPRFGLPVLAACALAAILTWLATERVLGGFTHSAAPQMHRASQIMQAASQVVRAEKRERGLLQPPDIDPNQTGLLGPEYTDITTSLGVLAAKRTATNPDMAAMLVRQIEGLDLAEDAVIVAVLSGSMVGANVATLAAIEALGLEAVIVASVSASMYGATDLDFTWLDMEALLYERGLVSRRSDFAVIGGTGAVGRGLNPEGIRAIRDSAARNAVPLLERDRLDQLLAELMERIDALSENRAGLLINAGGSVAAFGTCANADRIPSGLFDLRLHCEQGQAGVIVTMAARGVPVIHLLNMRQLAGDWGLPYDPIPLPVPGNNSVVYGAEGLF